MSRPPIDVTFTQYRGVRSRGGRLRTLPWADFVDHLRDTLASPGSVTPEPREHDGTAKDKAKALDEVKVLQPSIVCAEFDGGHRTNANAGPHTANVIDVDSLGEHDLDAFLERCAALTCVVYETAKSTRKRPRLRVVAAQARPTPPELVPAARGALARELGLDPDACGTADANAVSQPMFIGRVGGTRERRIWTFEGQVWKAPKGLAPVSLAPVERGEAAEAIYAEDEVPDLSALRKHIEPEREGGRLRGGRAMCRAIGGRLARLGYHPEAIWSAVYDLPSSQPDMRAYLAREAADAFYEGIANTAGLPTLEEHFGPGVWERVERAFPPPRWVRAYGKAALKRVTAGEARTGWRMAMIEWAGLKAEDAATPPAPGAEQDGTGLHLHAATGWPWILQRRDSYWLHDPSRSQYLTREVAASELEASVARKLAGIISDEERQPKELRASWIQPVKHLRSTYMARAHTYDPQTETLTLASLRWAELPAQPHEHIDRWLRVMFGAGYDAAAQWLAAVVELTRPAPCLYLPGPRGLGKSLLASGLAALWCRPEPVKMRDAIKDFNQSTGECPLIFTDEGFPEKLNFSEFREMITQHSRPINAKFKAPTDVEGCGRFMIAANNEDALRYQKVGTLTRNDLDAIADRLLVLECAEAAREIVDRLDTAAAASHEIAEHVLWLAETVLLEPHGRMAAKPGGGDAVLANVVAVRNADILARIRDALCAGKLGEASGVTTAKLHPGAVLVHVETLLGTLDPRTSSVASVKECCASLQLRPGTVQHKTADGQNRRWRVLDRSRLVEAFARLD